MVSFNNKEKKCEGWDLNPRTPARSGPEPDAVDQAWLPSRLYTLCMELHKDRGLSPSGGGILA